MKLTNEMLVDLVRIALAEIKVKNIIVYSNDKYSIKVNKKGIEPILYVKL